jgi:hypothetical protein
MSGDHPKRSLEKAVGISFHPKWPPAAMSIVARTAPTLMARNIFRLVARAVAQVIDDREWMQRTDKLLRHPPHLAAATNGGWRFAYPLRLSALHEYYTNTRFPPDAVIGRSSCPQVKPSTG